MARCHKLERGVRRHLALMTNDIRARVWPSLGLALTLLGGCAEPHRAPDSGPDAQRAFLNALVQGGDTPGAQYIHVSADSILFEYSTGQADLARRTPVEQHTVFHGYSVTKTLTAAAVFMLAARGKLDLDAPMSRWIHELPSDSAGPTVRQTLGHLGGFPNPVPIGWVHLAEDDAKHDESAFWQRILKEHGELDRPGEKFSYSNVGYLALGEVIARVSGKSYARYIQDEVLAPLGLEPDASLGFALECGSPRATGYVRRWSLLGVSVGFFLDRSRFLGPAQGAWVPLLPAQVDGLAYGGLVGNARGFARYLQAILRREGPFSESVVRAMFERGQTSDGEATPAAHGWFMGELAGQPFLHHAGAGGGYYAEIRVYPRLARASVLLTNRSGMKDDRILNVLDAEILRASPRGTEPSEFAARTP
jgi:D-alanyl-D-alanine carboxypeptidase